MGIRRSVLRLIKVLFKSHLFWCLLFFGGAGGVIFYNFDKLLHSKSDYFCVKAINFEGNDRVSEVLLLKTSGIRYNSNIFLQSLQKAKDRLETVSWIKSATVQRSLPDKIFIKVVERTPIAILQSKYKLYLVDTDGVPLENDGMGDFSHLPIIVGDGAEKEVGNFLKFLEKYPNIQKQLVFLVRVGKRRWDMKINRGVTVKLPERGVDYALGILDTIADSRGFFYEDISVIDLRLLDRIIIKKSAKTLE